MDQVNISGRAEWISQAFPGSDEPIRVSAPPYTPDPRRFDPVDDSAAQKFFSRLDGGISNANYGHGIQPEKEPFRMKLKLPKISGAKMLDTLDRPGAKAIAITLILSIAAIVIAYIVRPPRYQIQGGYTLDNHTGKVYVGDGNWEYRE